MSIFFTSDQHYFHRNVIRLSNRPFENMTEMHDKMIENYNSKVGRNDCTYFLGDFSFENDIEANKQILNRMNGKKVLIIGNHDKKPSRMMAMGFAAVFNTATLRIAQKNVMLCHYPYAPSLWKRWRLPKHSLRYMERRPPKTCDWLLHGHTHSKTRVYLPTKSIHVGVDAWNFYPVGIREVEGLSQKNSR